jgi:hypothetical protein
MLSNGTSSGAPSRTDSFGGPPTGRGQGLTLVHVSAHPEPFLPLTD